jgi:hypothetical protein
MGLLLHWPFPLNVYAHSLVGPSAIHPAVVAGPYIHHVANAEELNDTVKAIGTISPERLRTLHPPSPEALMLI